MKIGIPELLDRIKEMFEGSENSTIYRIVKVPARYDGSASLVCDTEIVWKYDDLCVKMFDLDVSGWEISEEVASDQALVEGIGGVCNVVTIRMTRPI